MANGLESGDSIKNSDTFSFFRGERSAQSAGRRDVKFTDLKSYLEAEGFTNSNNGGGDTARIDALEKNLGLNTLRDVVSEGWSIIEMVDGFADEYHDESGVNTGSSSFVYDGTGDYYTTPQGPSDGDTDFYDASDSDHTITTSGSQITVQIPTGIGGEDNEDPYGGAKAVVRVDVSTAVNYVDMGSDADFLANNFKIGAWVKFDSVGAGVDYVAGRSAGSGQRSWAIQRNGTNLNFIFYLNGSSLTNINAGTVAANTWYYFEAIRDGGTISTFLDGVAGTSDSGVGASSIHTPSSNPGRVYIGTWGVEAGNTFSGELADLQIWNGSSSPSSSSVPVSKPTSGSTDEVLFLEPGTGPVPASAELVGATQTANTAPTNARLVVLFDPIDSVTLNTDLILTMSMDGGSTYSSAFTLEKEADYDSNIQILTTNDLTLSGTSGTSIVYKFTTANSKELRIHGVYVQWR